MKKPVLALLLGFSFAWPVSPLLAQEAGGSARKIAEVDRAQSGAAAANEARIYTAQLRRCEGLRPERKLACVEAARR